ncbi:MAG: methyltransferase domain-containing protein [Candidatus Krumholzibacteriota bacterium]|nr:methyltransferase domain-containing protein [Candidatus Krumholzibacteriota bacterium]
MIKQLIKGMATFIPGALDLFSRRRTGGTESARYCYSVWLRHLVMADSNGLSTNPKVIAELGPGDSIGIGLAALISGAAKYYAFDIVDYATVQKNVVIFDELLSLFRNKEDIPGEDEFPRVEPFLNSYTFPGHILTDDRLRAALDDRRIELIRQSVVDVTISGSMIQYKVPWYDSNIIEKASIDMIFSQAVLEHVDEIERTYERMYSWLKPNGFMSHAIDFKSHGSANEWNGHWAYSDLTWKLIKGRRPYLINRLPHSQHIKLMNDAGFKVVCDVTNELPSRIRRHDLAQRFRNMQQDDLTTSSTFIQSSISQ